jgi:hypothetical protein
LQVAKKTSFFSSFNRYVSLCTISFIHKISFAFIERLISNHSPKISSNSILFVKICKCLNHTEVSIVYFIKSLNYSKPPNTAAVNDGGAAVNGGGAAVNGGGAAVNGGGAAVNGSE